MTDDEIEVLVNTLKEMEDVDLLERYDSARGTMSYYNACESGWSSEATGRAKARQVLDIVFDELQLRNLKPNPGQWLC